MEKLPKALLVDRDGAEGIMAEVVLEHLGYKVYRAKAATEALVLADLYNPEMIILPTQMLCDDRTPLVAALRAKAPLARARIVALLDHENAETVAQCRGAHFDGYISKVQLVTNTRSLLERLTTSPWPQA